MKRYIDICEKTKKQYLDLIELAKDTANKYYYDTREWVTTSIKVEGWSSGEYDLDLIVRTGSPCKGHILVDHGSRIIRVFSNSGNILKTFKRGNYWGKK